MRVFQLLKPLLSSIFCLSSISAQAATPIGHLRHAQTPSVRLVHEFPKPTWVENLAVMHNGSILTTIMTVPQLYMINPFTEQNPVFIHEFPGYLGLLGITETSPDVFAVIAGNFSLEPLKSYPGTYSVWCVDMRHSDPQISKIADVPEASFLNGMASLGPSENAVLMADSTLGVAFKLDLSTGVSTIAIDDPLMKKPSPDALEGINGLKIHRSREQDYAYFTNGNGAFLARIPIRADGSPAGASSIIAYSNDPAKYIFDDFAVGRDGTAYVATGSENVITKIEADGRSTIIAGSLNSTEIAEPTALAFGRTSRDWNTVYVSTGGALGDPINGSVIVGGQIVALDLG